MNKFIPTIEQEKVIAADGNIVVYASAGTGKTATLIEKIKKDINKIQDHKIIAAITFTTKATQEIVNRLGANGCGHYISTNNGFVIEEIIKPFFRDVYKINISREIKTSYDNNDKVDTFEKALEKLKNGALIVTLWDNKKNFIFRLALQIVESSKACREYLKSRFYRIYVDEYQDCDTDMNNFFIYLAEQLGIFMFIVGDEKQAIYQWRGAYPQAFTAIKNNEQFTSFYMFANHRSCQAIQNYSNLIFQETREQFGKDIKFENGVRLLRQENWIVNVKEHLLNIPQEQKSAVLRYRHDAAGANAKSLTDEGMDFTYLPNLPIDNISTEDKFLYRSVANYLIVTNYNKFDLFEDIRIATDRNLEKRVDNILVKLHIAIQSRNNTDFEAECYNLWRLLGFEEPRCWPDLLETVKNEKYHCVFKTDTIKNVSMTFHASKGLEFDNVVIFIDDYNFNNSSELCNHYVASTRAKKNLFIVNNNKQKWDIYINYMKEIANNLGLKSSDIYIKQR